MAAALFVCSVEGKTYSDKTFMMPRSVLTNVPMEYATWHKRLHKKADSKYNGSIHVVPFYQESEEENDTAEYFGFNWTKNLNLNITNDGIVSQIGVTPQSDAGVADHPDHLFTAETIIHNYNWAAGNQVPMYANYSFRPDQEVYGVRISYNQDLDRILDGLFVRFNAPIAEVMNDMNIKSLVTEVKTRLPEGATIAQAGPQYGLLDYLAGQIENNYVTGQGAANNLQEPLKYAKITAGSHSKSGIADIEATLGYTLWHKTRLRIDLLGSMIVPTGNTPNGDYVFEPVYGNGHHWGVTAALDASCKLWNRPERHVKLTLVAKYKYLFPSTERRTLDFILNDPAEVQNFVRFTNSKPLAGYYLLGGKNGVAGVFPLANVLTQDLQVSPGSQFEAMVNVSFFFKGIIFDLGYDFYAREKEAVALKHTWENDTYALAKLDYNTNADFGSANRADASWINEDKLDFDTVRTPDQITHKAYTGLGYEWEKLQYPVMLGLGFAYEVSNNNSALTNWQVWGKLAVSW
jgi:hypothetical protein